MENLTGGGHQQSVGPASAWPCSKAAARWAGVIVFGGSPGADETARSTCSNPGEEKMKKLVRVSVPMFEMAMQVPCGMKTAVPEPPVYSREPS